jgi:molybdenum cofactor cytidylyltransferase
MPCCVPPDPRPLVAVLAAGGATRFGGGKLDALLAGKPVGQWALEAAEAAGLGPGLIVVGVDAPQFAAASGWQLLVNPRAAEGLGTSLASAAGQALAQGRALLVVLADMPLVDPAHLARLASAKATAATLWPNGKAGVPARFGPGMLPQVAGLAGDAGAGALLTAASGVELFEAPADMLLDVDCPEDLARAEALFRKRG